MSTKPGMQLAPSSPFLEQVAGTDKGKIFELEGLQISIGRAKENQIVVASEAVSRVHARLIQSDGAWFIRDNDSRNGIVVNGKNVRQSWLQDGDVVQVGDFVCRFRDPLAAPAGNDLAVQAPAASQEVAAPLDASAYGIGAVGRGKKKKKPNRRVLIYGTVLVLGAMFYLMQGGEPDKNAGKNGDPAASDKLARDFDMSEKPDLKAEPKPKKLVGIDDPILKEAERQMATLDWTNTSLRQAEQFFKKGQREYLNQNYQRAIEYFQTALQLYRSHFLADRYLKRSIYESEAMAKEHMARGVEYYTSLQYQRAMYHFGEVIPLMAHRPQEPIIAEANKYIEICKKVNCEEPKATKQSR